MAVVLDKANVVLVDKDGNRATVTSLTDNDLNKLSVGLSDVSDLKTRVKAVEDNGYISYNSVQTLNESQRSQAQANMDAPGLSVNNTFTGNMTVEANVKADSMTLNTRSDYAKLSASTNDHGIKLLGGSSATTGASIDLRGSTDTDAPNTFTVSAANGVALAGSKTGSLTWNNENVVRKVNNLPADASGNVLLGTEKSTFNKVVYDTGYFSITTSKTYNFDLTGSDLANVSKENVNIRLIAKVVTASGGFKVGDIAQLTTAADHSINGDLDICSYIRGNTLYIRSGDNQYLSIQNEIGWLLKANVQIKAVLTAFIPDDGSILLIAEDQTNTSKLIGMPDGTLTWGDKNLVRSVNGVNADANGDIKLAAGGSKELGEIFYSTTPMDNVNYHLLDGTILDGNAEEYKQFYNYLLSIKPTYASLFITENDYQTQLNDKGVCGKYVLDEVNKTIRLPKITGFVEGTVDSSALGDLVEAGLPNITGELFGFVSVTGQAGSGSLHYTYETTCSVSGSEHSWGTLSFDASNSNSIYGNSTTVQPQSIKLFVYVVVNNGSVEDAPLDVTKEYQLNNPFSLFDYRYVSHRLNNASWVLSTNTFLSADLYPSAYEKLLAELNESSIGLSVKRTTDAYTDYDYVVDTENNSFRLPLVIKERVLVESKVATDEDPTWYNLYSDGWLEQGGLVSVNNSSQDIDTTISLNKAFTDTKYQVLVSYTGESNTRDTWISVSQASISTTSFIVFTVQQGANAPVKNILWYACGYAQDKPSTNLYFYLGDTVSNPSLIELGFVQDRIGKAERRFEGKIGNLSKVCGMPDYSSGINITSSLSAVNSSWTAPANGIIQARAFTTQMVYLNKISGLTSSQDYAKVFISIQGISGMATQESMLIEKGTTIYTSSNLANSGTIMFYPFKTE